MNEKIFKTMSFAGACAMIIGIVILAAGLIAGIMNIVNGGILLKNRKHVTF